MSNKRNYICPKYAGYYYLRSFDLRPERLDENCPCDMGEAFCEELNAQGLLFRTREDALRVREVMLRAYVNEVMAVKGADSILFKRKA